MVLFLARFVTVVATAWIRTVPARHAGRHLAPAQGPHSAARLHAFLITVTGVALATSGVTTIAAALASQEPTPQLPPSAAGSVGPTTAAAATPVAASASEPVPEVVERVLPTSRPVAIDIPAIGVHSVLQYLGMTAQNTLQVPAPGPHYDEAAWYTGSSPPGSRGPAIVVGHVDSPSAGPSVFFDLAELRPGDEVLITRVDGLVAAFTVDGVRQYPKADFPSHLVYGDTDHAALRLITCGGAFDDDAGHYLDSVVVFASLAGSH